MKLTDQQLIQQRNALLSSLRRREITSHDYKKKVAKLIEKQEHLNYLEEERRYQLYLQKKQYIKNLEKSLDNLNNKNITFNIDMKNIPKNMKVEEVLSIITKKSYDKKNLLHAGDTFITLNNHNIQQRLQATYESTTKLGELKKLFDTLAAQYYEGDQVQDSWVAFIGKVKTTNSKITVSNVPNNHSYNKSSGAWFKYNHKMNFDFSRYGVYKITDKPSYNDTCLISALLNGGLEEPKVELIKVFVRDRNIPACKIEEICQKIKSKIVIKKNDGRTKIVYGSNFENTFNIGLIEEHYFIIEPINITSYAINNYHKIKDLSNWNLIYKERGKYFKQDSNRTIDSFDAITLLIENKEILLQQIDFTNSSISSSQFYDKIEDRITTLEYDEDIGCIPVVCSDLNKETKIKYENVFFDVETYLDENNKHIPYVVCSYNNGIKNKFSGDYCIYNFLNSLKKDSRLIAHNANYDYRFIIKHLRNINEISRGSHLIGCSGKFFDINIEIKDSYHLISKPLKAFPESFKLGEIVKEVMPYELYNKETVKQRFLDIDYVLENYIKEDDKLQFLNNIKRWNLQKENTYDIISYSIEYCHVDCEILAKGYNIFRSWMLECVNIDIDKILTIASLAHRYFVNEGCYEGVNQISGVPQIFIQGSVVGGRTMISENKKISINEKINDFDAVSLYPSAMSRMDGFLKGNPKVIKDLNYSFISKQDGYFVDIIINSVGIKRKFPLMSIKNENGIRIFTNDMIGKTIRLDKYSLEDLIKFHNITFSIVRGYYFNQGFNTKIKDTIQYLFNERLNKKKQGNPIQEVYKLIMNSGYGKSIMKPIDSITNIFDKKETFNTYLSRNYNWIKEFNYFGDKVKVKSIKPINDHYNIAHIGSMILSMSKRIMNEVMCLAEDNNIDLYYQDTDSIHIKDQDISILSNIFKIKYNKDLIGKNLGQFHSDFEMKGCKNIIATKSIFLGKKCYIDRLEGENSEGKKEIDYHIRMKGIPNSVILYTSKKLKYSDPMEMYEDLYKGKKIEFDLTNDGSKCNFKMNKDYSVNTLEVFKRVICF